jgi:vitamin B12 transporter
MLRVQKTRLALSALAGIALTPALLTAQEARDTVRLEEIVVTGTRVAIPRSASTAAVTVISGAELREKGATHLIDALRMVPGVTIAQNGSVGAVASLFLRGGQSDYVQILVDGVPMNEPGGRADLANLTTDDIERIEIVRGPTSVLYGSSAVSGVVQVFTRQGRSTPTVSASVRGGNRGALGLNADLGGSTAGASYAVSASHFGTDGIYAYNNQYRNSTLGGKVRLAPDAATDLTLSLRYSDSEFHYPTDGAGRLVDQNAFQMEERTTLALEAGRFFTERLEGRLLVTASAISAGIDDQPDSPVDTLGMFSYRSEDNLRRRGVDARLNAHLAPGTVLTVGAALEGQRQRSSNHYDSEWGPGDGAFNADRTNRGYYAQMLADVAGALSLQAGARIDDNTTFGTFTTYRGALAYRLSSGTRLRAAVGSAFKEPTFSQSLSSGYTIGNADLHPERSRSWEAGLEQSLLGGRLTFGGTYFDQRFRDMIQYRELPFGSTEPNYYNIARADAAGFELETRAEPLSGLTLSAGYTHLSTKVRDAGFQSGPDAEYVEGERLIRRPTHSGNVGIAYRRPGQGALDLAVLYTGKRDDLDFTDWPAHRVTLDAYTRVDLGGEVVLLGATGRRAGLAATLRVDNLFGTKYQEIVNFPARGRTFLIGARTSVGL